MLTTRAVSIVRPRPLSRSAALVTLAVVAGSGSLLVARMLGYDAWAWMVWAREVTHGELSTVGGPAFHPLPVLLVAPLTPLGDVAPMAWLALMRVSALLALVLAARVGATIAGWTAGTIAAVLLAAGPDLYRTAMYGFAEPLLLVLVLGAADRYLADRRGQAFVLLAFAGLIRPEAWAMVFALALLDAVRARRIDPLVVATAVIPPAIWLVLTSLGSHGAPSPVTAVPANGLVGADVAGRTGEAIAFPALAFAAVALFVHRRRREVLLIGAVAVAWVLIVAVMAQFGYPGSRRYLLLPASLVAVLAGAGVVATVAALRRRRAARVAVGVALVALLGVIAFPSVRESARLISVARTQERQLTQLRRAVDLAGGPGAVKAYGRPAVNPWLQTALAWRLDAPLRDVQGTWHSSRRTPHWRPPAVVFRGPGHLLGPTPALPRRWPVTPVGRVGSWRVLRAPAIAARTRSRK